MNKILDTKQFRTSLSFLLLPLTIQCIKAAPIPAENDRIGWSSDGNKVDPDDWAATALALAVFAKMGWQEKLVHFDYHNRLDGSLEWNSSRILVTGESVTYWLNEAKTAEYEMRSEKWNKQIAGAKFGKWKLFGTTGSGHVALQDHGHGAVFKNIRIKDLSKQ